MTARPRSRRTAPGQQAGRDGFAQLLRAEWTKFRTVRGWVIGLVVAALVMAGLGLLDRRGRQQLLPDGRRRRPGPQRPGLRAHFHGGAGRRGR